MIKVLIDEKKGFVSIKGHSESAPKGEDLVCAGVSSVVTGCFNSIKEVNSFKMKLTEGDSSIEAKVLPVNAHDKVVIETLINSLKTIAEEYPQFIEITQR